MFGLGMSAVVVEGGSMNVEKKDVCIH
jgi:hypothetical protein